MAKSMYSLMLSNEIVAAVDRMAAHQGTNRSALVNHILAEYTSLSTPEKRLRDIFSVVEQGIGGQLRSSVSAGGTLTLRTAVQYKYNPQLSYSLELTQDKSELGRLKVGLRSQNETLLLSIQLFFQLWSKLEQAHLPVPPGEDKQRQEPKRFLRSLRRPLQPYTDKEAGEAIAAYVGTLDQCLKTYFGNLPNAEQAVAATEQAYRAALPHLGLAIEF